MFRLRFTRMIFFDHSLWKQTVHIDIIDPFYNSRKGHHFRKRLNSCDMPAINFNSKYPGSREKVEKSDFGQTQIQRFRFKENQVFGSCGSWPDVNL